MISKLPAFKRIWLFLIATLLLIVALYACSGAKSSDPPSKRPVIGLMTTLPLQWEEGDIDEIIGSKGAASPAYIGLNAVYEMRPIDNLSPQSLKGVSALMLAQSRALSPGELTDLDLWVRKGGKLLLLADPALHWESIYPLGDKRRPLFTTLFSPLFAHWGLELVLPVAEGDEKYQNIVIDGQTIHTVTIGAWQYLSDNNTECTIAANPVVAKCQIGSGRAVLVADADLLDGELWQGSGVRALLGANDFANISWIEKQLGALSTK